MSCENCNKLTQHGAPYCNDCHSTSFCSMCNFHSDRVGPLRQRLGNNCCEDCLNKSSTLKKLKEEDVEMESISMITENPTYLKDLLGGWWSDGDKYYFTIQGDIYSATDIPMDFSDFKRAILFDTIDAEWCGVVRGTTVIWA